MVFAICIGIGLSAACGFRVFMPMLALSAASKLGVVHLNSSFAWLASWPALLSLGTAAVLETGSYFVPWVAHAVSVAATPAAIVAGTLATAAQIDGINPLVHWAGSLVVGGGLAGGLHAANVALRGTSTLATAGLANPLVSVGQDLASITLAILAIAVPMVVLGLAVGVAVTVFRRRRARQVRAGTNALKLHEAQGQVLERAA